MSSTLERLRRLHGLSEQKSRTEPKVPAPRSQRQGALEALVAGREITNSAGACYLSSRRYPLTTVHGLQPLGKLLESDPSLLAAQHPKFGLETSSDFLRAAFIDTETTGLGGGAGVYAFMVGVGLFEAVQGGGADFEFVVHQLFMRSPAEEAALLIALSELLDGRDLLVTFNGRTFDLPLLRTRFRQNSWALGGVESDLRWLDRQWPHLDLLHPARRLWRRRLGSCRLANLERRILQLERSEEDVAGHLIPELYIHYVRSGDAGEMRRIFYHNREDIVSMVALAERISALFDEQNSSAQPVSGADWISLGLCYERDGKEQAAEEAYGHAIACLRSADLLSDAYARLARLRKRQARWAEAAEIWQQWLTSVPNAGPDPYVELAKYCEWRMVDLEQAEMWTRWALHTVEKSSRSAAHAQVAELKHRLARIVRKRSTGTPRA